MTQRPRRRVRTAPPPGSDPTPQRFEPADGGPAVIRAEPAAEDRPSAWGERDSGDSNDARIRENIPPHNV